MWLFPSSPHRRRSSSRLKLTRASNTMGLKPSLKLPKLWGQPDAAPVMRKSISWKQPVRVSLCSESSEGSPIHRGSLATHTLDRAPSFCGMQLCATGHAQQRSSADDVAALLLELPRACAGDDALAASAAQVSPATALRYLLAHKDGPTALVRLLDSLRWRARGMPGVLCGGPGSAPVWLRWVGTDMLDQPVAYVCLSCPADHGDASGKSASAVSRLEAMDARLDAATSLLTRWVVILDFAGAGLRHANPLAAVRLSRALQAHYPERLALAVLYECPWPVSAYLDSMPASLTARSKLLIVPGGANGPAGGQGPAAWPTAGAELAAWLAAEARHIRSHRARRPSEPQGGGDGGGHDRRGTASWLAGLGGGAGEEERTSLNAGPRVSSSRDGMVTRPHACSTMLSPPPGASLVHKDKAAALSATRSAPGHSNGGPWDATSAGALIPRIKSELEFRF